MLANGQPEAYITFVNDHRACVAFLDHKLYNGNDHEEAFDVQPAYTWHKPFKTTVTDLANATLASNNNEANLNTSPIFNLNDDCFLALFDYCDIYTLANLSEVCTKFKSLLDHHYFPLIGSLKVNLRIKNHSMTLGKLRKILRCVGHHITKLELKFDYIESSLLRSYLEKIVQYTSENIRELRILDVYFTEELSPIVKPIGEYLEKIYIHEVNYRQHICIDLYAIFPNVTELKCHGYAGNSQCCRAWPKLKYWMNERTREFDIDHFLLFITLNPQLEGIGFDYKGEKQIHAIIQHLPDIKEITISNDSSHCVVTETSVIQLKSLKSLSKLCLWFKSEKNCNEMLNCLSQLVGLRKLNLYAKKYEKVCPNQEKISALSKSLPHLEHFELQNIELQESTIVDFVRLAIQLQKIVLKNCGVFATRSFIEDIVSARQSNQNQEKGPLELIVDCNDENDLAAIGEKDVRKYLIVKIRTENVCSIYKKNVV